jgi:hypothetical protein
MKRIPIIVLAIMLLSGMAYATVPYPYGNYELTRTGDLKQVYRDVDAKYTVLAQSEKSSTFPWDTKSYATLQAPEVVEAKVNFDAAHKFMSSEEREQELAEMGQIYTDNVINFTVGLYSCPGISGGYGYTEINGYSSYIARVIMETDDGRRFEPLRVYSGTSSLSGRQWWAFNSVTFPRYDEDGKQIINENTKWIKLWVISHNERIFFEFVFKDQ